MSNRLERVVRAKGYSRPTVRRDRKGQRIGAVIPTKADQAADLAFALVADRERNVVARLINRLKPWRRIATRDEKRAANDETMLTIVCLLRWR